MKSYNNDWPDVSLPQLASLRPGQAVAPLLSPDRLEPLAAEAVQAFLHEGESANTLRSYRTALRYWAGWYSLRYGTAIRLPLTVPAVLQFIVDHAQRSSAQGSLSWELPPAVDEALVVARLKAKTGALSLATVEHRLAVLSKLHQLRQLDNPCQAGPVRELMARVRRAYARRGVRQKKAEALHREPLEVLLSTCDDTMGGVRDRALLMFAWSSGGRRRSEVAQARFEDLRQVGQDQFVFVLRVTKTNPTGRAAPGDEKPITGRAGQALAEWVRRARIQEGALFRRVLRGGHVGGPLSASAVRDIVRHRAALAELSGGFSAHSLRSGFVTEAVRRNVPLPQAMALSGHKSVATFRKYFQEDLAQTLAVRLLDD